MSIKERNTLLCGLAFAGCAAMSSAMFPIESQAATSHIERIEYAKSTQGSITFHVGKQQLSNKSPGITVHVGDEVQINPDKPIDTSIFAIHLSSKMNAAFNSTGSAQIEFVAKTAGAIWFEVYSTAPGLNTAQRVLKVGPITNKSTPSALHTASKPIGKFFVTVVK